MPDDVQGERAAAKLLTLWSPRDLDFYVVGVRNLVRAVEALNRLYGDPGLATELATFEAAVPNFKTLRNFVEHFDGYDNKSGQLHLGTKKLTASVPLGRMGYAQAYDFPTGDASIEIFGLRL